MPKALQYRPSSVIYFQGDLGDKIYILQAGKVSLNYTDIENGQDVHDLVQPGEFFGVKSAMGRYPREENALVLQDSSVVAFSVPEFEQLAMSNIRIVMKMLKVFSNQLRRIHKQVSNLLEKEEQLSPEVGLFKVGEYYLKARQYAQSKYVFARYLTYYPAGKLAPQAAKYVEASEGALSRYGDGKGPAPIFDSPAASKPVKRESEMSSVAKAYYDAVSLFSQDKFPQALAMFRKIVEENADEEYVAKSVYEIGRCLFLSGKFDECVKHYTAMFTSYPKHPDLGDALFFMAQSYEKLDQADRAASLYKKILTMATDEDDMIHMKAKKALKAMEA